MGEPANGIALAAAGGVFDKVIMPGTFGARRVHELVNRLPLVVAREDHALLLNLAAVLGALLKGSVLQSLHPTLTRRFSGAPPASAGA